jgi:hypothetical protein
MFNQDNIGREKFAVYIMHLNSSVSGCCSLVKHHRRRGDVGAL